MAGMRWSTAVSVVTSGVEAHIAQLNGQAGKGSELLYLLKQIAPPSAGKQRESGDIEVVPARPTGKRPQPGTIPDRVLAIVGEAKEDRVTLGHILSAKHGAKDYAVKLAIRGLVKSGHLVATGSTSTRRYGLPTKRKGAR